MCTTILLYTFYVLRNLSVDIREIVSNVAKECDNDVFIEIMSLSLRSVDLGYLQIFTCLLSLQIVLF